MEHKIISSLKSHINGLSKEKKTLQAKKQQKAPNSAYDDARWRTTLGEGTAAYAILYSILWTLVIGSIFLNFKNWLTCL